MSRRNKAQLLETLNRQTELANEEKVLTEKWNKSFIPN